MFGLCFYYALLSMLSSFAIFLTKKEETGCFALIDFLMSFDCKCPVALPHVAVRCSAVCGCGIS